MLDSTYRMLNYEPVFVTYNLKTQEFECMWQMPLYVEDITISRDKVLPPDDNVEASELYSDVTNAELNYIYHIFKAKPKVQNSHSV